LAVLYSGVVSRIRRPFLSDRYFFVTVRLLENHARLLDADFRLLALAFNRARTAHRFFLSAWVFLPDPAAAGHAICAPRYPVTISLVTKSIKTSSRFLINREHGEESELWQPRFFDRAWRTVEEYNEKLDYIHQNPVSAGPVCRPRDWPWSSVNEYCGMSAAEQQQLVLAWFN
jgi:putative transposase